MFNYEKAIDVIEKDYLISPCSRYLKKHGMYSAAIFYKNLNETLMLRTSRAIRHLFENASMPIYEEGQGLFVNHKSNIRKSIKEEAICSIDFDGRCLMNEEEFEKLPTENTLESELKKIVTFNCKNMYTEATNMRYLHYGVHNVVDIDFVLKHGFNGYRDKILKELENATTAEKIQFEQAMLEISTGIITYVENYKSKLKSIKNPSAKLQKLINAMETVPLNPAGNFYQACVSIYATMYFSDCFEPGRLDNLLYPYYENDPDITRDEALSLIREMLVDMEKRPGHPSATHVTVGGSKTDGTGDYNEITELCIIAIAGLRTPNMSLRVTKDMPEKYWDLVMENLSKGHAQPAIVNEDIFIEGLVNQYDVPIEDAVNYVFGGCSEVLIQGKTCCDSTWTAYNMLDVFEHTMYNKLMECETFEEFYSIFKNDIEVSLADLANQINIRQHSQALNNTWPLRSLMTGGCIESGKTFMGGGTPYNFDSTNVYGTTNSINAVYTIKKFFEGEFGDLSKEDFLKCFVNNYQGYEEVYNKIQSITKYGNYNEEINEFTRDITSTAFNKIKTLKGYRGDNGKFMPTIVLWVTWVASGKKVGATPDGRFASDVLADSAGPTAGTDLEGPTSAMGATLAIPQEDCVGTCVLNLRLDKNNFNGEENCEKIKNLFKAYFAQGGCQLQVNVVDRDTLLDALKNPEKHRDLIVRVGGFSDNFVYLSDDIKEQIILRTEY